MTTKIKYRLIKELKIQLATLQFHALMQEGILHEYISPTDSTKSYIYKNSVDEIFFSNGNDIHFSYKYWMLFQKEYNMNFEEISNMFRNNIKKYFPKIDTYHIGLAPPDLNDVIMDIN